MSYLKPVGIAVLVVLCLLAAALSLGLSESILRHHTPNGDNSAPAIVVQQYSFHSPAITTQDSTCRENCPSCTGYECIFRYSKDINGGVPTADQPWEWSYNGISGGIATQGSAWDPIAQTGPAAPAPPSGPQFAFLQCTSQYTTSYMRLSNVQLTAGQQYIVKYSIATRGSGYTIDPSTQFTLTYVDDTGTPTVISSAVPYTGQQWSDNSNAVQSALFTASSSGTLQFTMRVTKPQMGLDQAVVIDAVTILGSSLPATSASPSSSSSSSTSMVRISSSSSSTGSAPPSSSTCVMTSFQPGYDVDGTLFLQRPTNTSDISECRELCCADPRCVAFVSVTSTGGGICPVGSSCCYGKISVTGQPYRSASPNIVTGLVRYNTTASQQCAITQPWQGYDVDGTLFLVRQLYSASPFQECRAHCCGDSRCQGFVVAPGNGGNCAVGQPCCYGKMFVSAPTRSNTPNIIGGVVGAQPPFVSSSSSSSPPSPFSTSTLPPSPPVTTYTYSFESPAITTNYSLCVGGFNWNGYCVFRYSTSLPAPNSTADQQWTWNNGGIARQGSAWDPLSQQGTSPPDGVQFAFIQNLAQYPTSYMQLSNIQLVAGQQYYVKYSFATRNSEQKIIDPTTQFTLTYAGASSVPVTISSPMPYTGQLWNDSRNAVVSDVFTATSSTGTLQFTLRVTNSRNVDQAVVIDAISIIGLPLSSSSSSSRSPIFSSSSSSSSPPLNSTLQNSTLYSFESPAITTQDPTCRANCPSCTGYQCIFKYFKDINGGVPTVNQPWTWNNNGYSGGIAIQGSAWDPIAQTGPAAPAPPNGTQFAFIQCNSQYPSSSMSANAVLTAGQQYIVKYSIATRGFGYTIDPSTRFTVAYDGVVISSAVPQTGQQWSASSNPVVSAVFTASSIASLTFTMTVTTPPAGLDQAVVIDSISILPMPLAPTTKYSFEVPVQSGPAYFTYNPPQMSGQPFVWSVGAGGIAAKISPWYPADGNPYDGNQWAYLQTKTTDGNNTRVCLMSANISVPSNTSSAVNWRAGYRYQTDNLDSAVLSVYIVPIGGPLSGSAQMVYRKASGVSIASAWNSYTSNSFVTQSTDATLIFDITSPAAGAYDRAWLVDAITISAV